MRLKTRCVGILTTWATSSLLCPLAFADDLNPFAEFHGFVSQGFIKTTNGTNYLANSALGSFNFTECGINLTKQLTTDLRTGVQLFTRRVGAEGGFNAKIDWFYLDYHGADWLGLRFGRVKIPFGLYNEITDADSARVPILLPPSIYPSTSRDYLLAQNGLELYGYSGNGPAGALEYRLYGGTIFFENRYVPGNPTQVTAIDTPYVAGGRLMWDTPLEGLRTGGTFQALRIDSSILLGTTPFSFQIPATLWVGSLEYIKQDLSLAAEYSQWDVSISNSSNTALLPNTSVTSQRGYVMGAYRLNSWLEPALYYSVLYPNKEHREERQNYQHDLSATLRFDINRFWLVKLEGHYMVGTAGLAQGSKNTLPLSALPSQWGAFLIRTTGYF